MDGLEMVKQQIAQNNAWSAEQAQKQMDFQERMSNTAIQREVADMKAAGINPILSAKLGGASTPNGAMGTTDPSATSALVNILGQMAETQKYTAMSNAYGSGSGSGNNASPEGEITGDDVTGILGLFGLRIPRSTGNLIASVIDGVFGNNDTDKNKSTNGYKIGQYIGAGLNRLGEYVPMVKTAWSSLFSGHNTAKTPEVVSNGYKSDNDNFGSGIIFYPDDIARWSKDAVEKQKQALEDIKKDVTFKTSGTSKYVLPYKQPKEKVKAYKYNAKQMLNGYFPTKAFVTRKKG